MPTIQIETEQLLNAALQLPREELERFVARLFSLKAREIAPLLSAKEIELLLKINRGLPPIMQQRLNKLIEKRQAHTISQDELTELIELTDQVEQFDVERLQYLRELAQVRGVTLDEVIKHLDLKPTPHD